MTDISHRFGDESCQAMVNAAGAELSALVFDGDLDALWNAGPEWRRHSPVLFPIVGRLADDQAPIDGKTYRMTQHGFARDRVFEWIERTPAGCVLELRADDETQAIFPFAFVLRIAYRVSAGQLIATYTITNPDERKALPASLGVHPAFNWPLRPGEAREDYEIIFEQPENEPIRRVAGGLLLDETFPSPVDGRVLKLSDSLFVEDAVIFDSVDSRSVWFGRPGAKGLRVKWAGFDELGVWSKEGAPFLCIEPWRGHASPANFSGAFKEKPGLLHLGPGAEWTASWRVAATDA
ncbi:aldose 1-epimerase family protein [Acetobacter sacchari]|uniref:Aldose 1-epimerase family protein n=1 Tax=Acetobacter sacchari TaxID=2661687 RepID=A0ABS3LUJ3_9PROT|nr:aldose 1-epimerase family protein [Acetobacter sacchari]MBO1359570.1 aldose 1-epimerase family protein [Acetobacter sacchari]